MRDMVKVFKALSDANRIRILKMLEVRPLCVCEITRVINLATSTISKHLSILRDVDFIVDDKEGKWVTYSLNRDETSPYVQKLLPLISEWLVDEKSVKQDQEKVRSLSKENLCEI